METILIPAIGCIVTYFLGLYKREEGSQTDEPFPDYMVNQNFQEKAQNL